MFVLFAPSFVDYMCNLRNGELYPLRNMKALCNYFGNYFGGEECLRLCSVNFGNECSEGCRREWNGCKGIPQDQFGWIPKLTAWTG